MKKVVLFLIFFVSITTNIFAFNNNYFEVNNEGMKANNIGNGANFVLKTYNNQDYKCPISRCSNPPFISVDVEPLKGPRPSYDSMETAENLAKEHVKRLKEIDKRIRKFGTADYVIDRVSVDRFGDKRAFYYEITKSSNIKRVYTIASEKNIYTISINSCKEDNIKDTQAYRRFVDSFKILDSQPKSSNNKGNLLSVPETKTHSRPNSLRTSKSRPKRYYSNQSKRPLSTNELIFVLVCGLLSIIAWKIKKSL